MRISGVARGPGEKPLLERIIVTSGEGEIGKIEELAPFAIELEDGHRVEVELAANVQIEPIEIREGKWGDFEDDAALASLRASAPGPHVEVKVKRATLAEGARVEILAQDDAEHAFEDAASLRDAPVRRLVRITARAIASGDDAAAVLERMLAPKPAKAKKQKKQKEPRAKDRLRGERRYTELVIVALSLPCFALADWPRFSPLSVDLALLGVTLAAAGAFTWATMRLPRFISAGKVVGKASEIDQGRLPLFLTIFPVTFAIMDAFMDHDPASHTYNASWTTAVVVAIWAAFLAYLALKNGQAEARLFRVLLGAPALPADGPLRRTWGSFEGVVRDPTPVTAEGEAVAIVHVVSEEVVSGSDPNRYTERVLSKGTFFVDGEDGRSIEVNPDHAVWSSSVALRIPKKGSDGKIIEHVRAVPLRGSILVAGRVDRKEGEKLGHVAASGRESLVFVAVRQGEDARNECRAMLALRRVALAIALATIASAIGTMAFAEPRLPAFNLPEGG